MEGCALLVEVLAVAMLIADVLLFSSKLGRVGPRRLLKHF